MKAFINNNKFSLVFVVVLLLCGQCCWLYKLLLDSNFFSALPIEVTAVFTSVGPGKVPAVGTFAYVYFFALPLIYAAVGSGAVPLTVAIGLAYHVITGDGLPDSLMPQPEPEPEVINNKRAAYAAFFVGIPVAAVCFALGLGLPWPRTLVKATLGAAFSIFLAKPTAKAVGAVADSKPEIYLSLMDFLSANPVVALLAGSICLTALALLLVLLVLLADFCRNKQ